MEVNEPFKKDVDGLLYIDSSDVKATSLALPFQVRKPYHEHAHFYQLEGIEDFIAKDCVINHHCAPKEHLDLLKRLVDKQQEFDNIDFQVAYYTVNGVFNSIIIPYYMGAKSIQYMVRQSFSELRTVYDKKSDDIDNLMELFAEILTLIRCMYEKNIHYLDVNATNFLIYNNGIKTIDFEPRYVLFRNPNYFDIRKILEKFAKLVNKVLEKYNFNEAFERELSFYSAEKKIEELGKRMKLHGI